VEAQAQMKYHHSEGCFTYRIKKPMVLLSLRAARRQGLGFMGGRPLSREDGRQLAGVPAVVGSRRPREDPTVVKTAPIPWARLWKSFVSRHLPDGEFGWGGISVTRQRRCPMESSLGTEISG
jgi:hypothetical protein